MTICAHCPDEIIPTQTGWTHFHGVDGCTGQDGFEACNPADCTPVQIVPGT